MNKAERQNLIITAIQQNKKMTALELAKYCNVSKRTILRDIDDLENQGVKIYAALWEKWWLPNTTSTI